MEKGNTRKEEIAPSPYWILYQYMKDCERGLITFDELRIASKKWALQIIQENQDQNNLPEKSDFVSTD